MRTIGLQGRILGYFGLLVAAVVLGSFWLIHRHMENRVRAAAREQLETSRRVFEEILLTRAQGLVTAASLVAELAVFSLPLEAAEPARLDVACQRINQLVGSEVVIVTDRMGVVLGRTDPRWELGQAFRATSSVARALRGERASTMWVQDGRLYAMVSVPIRLATGLAGTLSVGYRVDGTFALELSLLSGHDIAFLVGPAIVAASRPLEPDESAAITALAGRLGEQGSTRPVYGEAEVGSTIPAIAVSPFFLSDGTPIASYAVLRSLTGDAAELRAVERQLALIALAALAAALAIGFVVSRSISRPLTDLAAGAHELGGGNYDFDLPAPTGAAEVEELTRSFESMRRSLRARVEELRGLTASLEEKVRDRTAALEHALAENRMLLDRLRRWNDQLEQRVEQRSRELAEAQQMLVRQDRMAAVGRLAAGVAHEINNPLGILSGFAEGLLDRTADPSLSTHPAFTDFPEYLRLIGQEVERLKTIVQKFLHFARSRGPQKQLLDLNDVAREVLELLANHAEREGKQLAHGVAAAPLRVEADPEQLKQVVLNLALNGLDAVDRGGRVTISTQAVGVRAEIRVADNGSGIPEELRGRIFDPFFSTKPPEKGTGLGLALCHDLVRENGGEIELAESAVGKGTIFVIRLPAAASTRLRAHG